MKKKKEPSELEKCLARKVFNKKAETLGKARDSIGIGFVPLISPQSLFLALPFIISCYK